MQSGAHQIAHRSCGHTPIEARSNYYIHTNIIINRFAYDKLLYFGFDILKIPGTVDATNPIDA